MQNVYLAIVLSPLFGAIIAGLFGRKIGRAGAHWATIIGVAVSFLLSLLVLRHHVLERRRAVQRHGLHLDGDRGYSPGGRLPGG
jgi:NADH:ubiquinone oxidoreductase subunit 5 (subunit L)/multisubunit Na+/H+ antiporter MnhA subunit